MHPKQKELLIRLGQVAALTAIIAYVVSREVEPLFRSGDGDMLQPQHSGSATCKNDLSSRVPQAVQLMDIAFPWKHEIPNSSPKMLPWTHPHPEEWAPTLGPEDKQAKKWIVITSINEPTEQIQQWATLYPEWQLLVVGDKKSPKDFDQKNCTFLSWEDQTKLAFKTSSALPWNNYSRKMIGYLYAIMHGAEVIFETDDDNGFKPEMPLTGFLPERSDVMTFKADPARKVVNPYAHFGIGSMWPRGYPINAGGELGLNPDAELFYESETAVEKYIPIQQSLADLDPDVDAIFRLTRAKELGSFKFLPDASPVSYPAGVMSPYNTQNTVHYKGAFALLFIPQSVAMRVCDIWRSYWAQRLLWEVGGEVAFLPASVDQLRSAHDFLGDFLEEVQMYTQAGKLVSFLRAWECKQPTLFDCAHKLTQDMAVAGYWGATDVDIMEAWLSDLYELGVENPAIKGLYTSIESGDEATITTMTGQKVRR